MIKSLIFDFSMLTSSSRELHLPDVVIVVTGLKPRNGGVGLTVPEHSVTLVDCVCIVREGLKSHH